MIYRGIGLMRGSSLDGLDIAYTAGMGYGDGGNKQLCYQRSAAFKSILEVPCGWVVMPDQLEAVCLTKYLR